MFHTCQAARGALGDSLHVWLDVFPVDSQLLFESVGVADWKDNIRLNFFVHGANDPRIRLPAIEAACESANRLILPLFGQTLLSRTIEPIHREREQQSNCEQD